MRLAAWCAPIGGHPCAFCAGAESKEDILAAAGRRRGAVHQCGDNGEHPAAHDARGWSLCSGAREPAVIRCCRGLRRRR